MASLPDLRYQKKHRTREELLKHMQTFSLDLKLSVGIWYFTPGGGRFHDRYVPDADIPERLKTAHDLIQYGVKGIEAHYPLEANEDNFHLYQQLEKDTGIKAMSIGPHIFWDKAYEFGSLSNPIDASRRKAKDVLVRNLKFVKSVGPHCHVGLWPGIDGYTYPLGTVFYEMWGRFESAVAEALDEVPGVRIAIEPKPYEPAPNNIYRTTADGLIACRDIEARLKNPENRKLMDEGHALVAMQPEVGHVRMGFEDLPYAYLRVARDGRLQHTHWNSQPLGNYDQDLNVGVVAWEQAEALLYALKMVGYTGYIGIDINPERMPMQKAIEVNARVLRIMNERIDALPHDKILECYFEPDKHRGELELILAESRRKP